MDRPERPAREAGWARLALATLILTLTITGLPASQALDDERAAGVLSPSIANRMLELIEMEALDAWGDAEAGYTALLETRALSDYERAVLLRQRGRASYELDNMAGAISDWRTVLSLAALPEEDANALRVNTAQLLLVDGQYRSGINLLEAAIARGVALNADLAMRLAQAYAQDDDHEGGLVHAREAFRLAEAEAATGRRHFSILLHYYQHLDRVPDQLSLMEMMVARWPDEKPHWTSYAALLAQTGREGDAFEVNRIMYVNGMLNSSEELIRLAQYYSWYDYPYGGAVMLEREFNAGRVEGSIRNMQLLANLWRHAREWERSLPVLERVATTSGAGPDYEIYGEALYQAARFREAEAMFIQALNRGGLSRPGDVWTYVGNARMELDDLNGASRAFIEALDWEYSRAGAQGWLDFIASKREILQAAARLEVLTTIETCELAIGRERRQVVTSEDEYDHTGRRVLDLPDICETWFNVYGDRLRAAERI